jgi:hypothetical protein
VSACLSSLSVTGDLRAYSGETTHVAVAGLVGSLRSEKAVCLCLPCMSNRLCEYEDLMGEIGSRGGGRTGQK